jgi:hypothetical protein
MTRVMVRSIGTRDGFVGTACAQCARDLDHCHGTLVVHIDGDVECTEPGCFDVDRVRHAFAVDCAGTLVDGCTCVDDLPTRATA